MVSHVQFAQELTSPVTSASVRKDTWERGKKKTAFAWQLLSSRAMPELDSLLCPRGDVVLRCKHPSAPHRTFRRPALRVPLSGIRMSIRLLTAYNIISASLLWHNAGLTSEGSSHERWWSSGNQYVKCLPFLLRVSLITVHLISSPSHKHHRDIVRQFDSEIDATVTFILNMFIIHGLSF